ncbi:hypothetical protein J6590_058141 [Homalodisca vitripennis]|nr:hypothetical protein J6590_058141 [Homalodisca vitripennis]
MPIEVTRHQAVLQKIEVFEAPAHYILQLRDSEDRAREHKKPHKGSTPFRSRHPRLPTPGLIPLFVS